MAPVTFHLLSIQPSTRHDDFILKVKSLDSSEKPLWFGRAHHWIHEPKLSTNALLGPGPGAKRWDYSLISSGGLPEAIKTDIASSWSITGNSPDEMPSAKEKTKTLLAKTPPALPKDWSASDSSGLDASTAREGVALSLEESSLPLGSTDGSRKSLKQFTKEFCASNPGPIVMFNLLSYLPGGRSIYFDGYVNGFYNKLGPMYGGDPIQLCFHVNDWSSKADEEGEKGKWEDAVFVWYPSLWHFVKMIDDPEYAVLDRQFKPTSLIDNPLICCSEIEI